MNGAWTAIQAGSYAAMSGVTNYAAVTTTADAVPVGTGFTVANSAKVATTLAGAVTDLATKVATHKHLSALNSSTTADIATALANITKAENDIATLTAVYAAANGTPLVAATTKKADTTSNVNRFRISFAGSGETDSGIAYGISGRADQQNGSTGGSQYISGAFGKIKMGDLGGADKDAAGHIAGGVGLSGMGSNNEIAYQAANHNLGYEFSTNGLTFGYSQDTAVQTGSNSAVGLKWSGDMGGTGLTVGVGQSKMGTATQNTMSLAVSMGGLTIKAISSSNDNGPATSSSDEVRHSTTSGAEKAYALAVTGAATPDTDHTGVSISYSVDALSVTAYSKTVSTTGSADKDYTGIGFAYDMGGATLKAGMVEDNKVSSMDIGISFSF